MAQQSADLSDEVLMFLAEFIQHEDSSIRVPRQAAIRGLYYLSNLTKATAMGCRDDAIRLGPLKKARRTCGLYAQFLQGSIDGKETARRLRDFTNRYVTYCCQIGINLQEEDSLLSNAGDYVQQNERFEWVG